MTLREFAEKGVRTARERGVAAAVNEGIAEFRVKGALPYTRWRATPIWNADWDVCLVLDGCRYDLWCETASDFEHGKTVTDDARISVGSASLEWINQTFHNRHRGAWGRAAYVTANPFSGKQSDDHPTLRADVYPLAERGLAYLDEVWRDQFGDNDDLATVPPDVLTDRAQWAWDRRNCFDMDRLVVHYMQPHVPFRSRPEWNAGWTLDGFGTGGGLGKSEWNKLRDGGLDPVVFWHAYRDNLEWVLSSVESWLQAVDGRVLITSDHGNAMGEGDLWGHPSRATVNALRRVPWVIVEGDGQGAGGVHPRGNPPVVGQENVLEEQLRALGYH